MGLCLEIPVLAKAARPFDCAQGRLLRLRSGQALGHSALVHPALNIMSSGGYHPISRLLLPLDSWRPVRSKRPQLGAETRKWHGSLSPQQL
jgi:hypothetical protein